MLDAPRAPARPVRPARSRRALLVAVLVVALLVVCVASVAVGSRPTGPEQVWSAFTAPTGSESDIVVLSLRVPRTLLGLLVGIALGVSGALMQGHTRNPLADPSLLGVSAGAGFGIVGAIQFLGVSTLYGQVGFGFAGALAAAVLVFALGTAARGGPRPVTLALAGLAVSQLLIAVTSAMVIGDGPSLDAYRFWSAGALSDRGGGVLLPILPFVLAGLVLAAANAPALNALALGEDTARGLGQRIGLARGVGLAAVTLLAGSAVAVSGPIGFVGLVGPHLVRLATGADHRLLLPAAGLAGGVLLVAADVVGRVVVPPGELQAGIVLALVGAPFFIVLVRRYRAVRL